MSSEPDKCFSQSAAFDHALAVPLLDGQLQDFCACRNPIVLIADPSHHAHLRPVEKRFGAGFKSEA